MENKRKNNQSISQKADQLIRNYQIFVSAGKEEVLDTLFRKIDEKEKAKHKPVRKITWFKTGAVSAAAVIAIMLAFWFLTLSQTIQVDTGDTLAIRLPDNSRVVLNDRGTLTFRKYFWNRNVQLTGQAYFEVDKGNGFKVKTPKGTVEVLGTRFFVDGLENALVVKCFQGKVKTSFEKNSWILEPATQFSGENGLTQKEKFISETGYPAFAQFNRSFSNTPLSLVIDEIEMFFGVNIQLNISSGKHFSGSFYSGNLENVLQIVCESLGMKYTFEENYRIKIYE